MMLFLIFKNSFVIFREILASQIPTVMTITSQGWMICAKWTLIILKVWRKKMNFFFNIDELLHIFFKGLDTFSSTNVNKSVQIKQIESSAAGITNFTVSPSATSMSNSIPNTQVRQKIIFLKFPLFL